MTDYGLDPRIVTYAPRYGEAFSRLNLEWIEKYFEVEPRDRLVLGDPLQTIIDPGGEVFFLLLDEEPVGTVALQAVEGGYELTKMAVAPELRGRGYGHRLMDAALDWARARGAQRIILYSNTMLEPALRLYRQLGFRTVRTGSFEGWARSDILMQLDLGRQETRRQPNEGTRRQAPPRRKEVI